MRERRGKLVTRFYRSTDVRNYSWPHFPDRTTKSREADQSGAQIRFSFLPL